MVPPSLNGPLCNVTAVIVCRYQLVQHSRLSDIALVGLGDLVVKDLVCRRDALLFHSYETAASRLDHPPLRSILHYLNPC